MLIIVDISLYLEINNVDNCIFLDAAPGLAGQARPGQAGECCIQRLMVAINIVRSPESWIVEILADIKCINSLNKH